ncbi:MAG: hypothetical protein LBO07_07750 [Coriobacteriales bacterium]|jgi:rubrerythrin|nr:hypothetical protein [Coriobacteriales bacterium]
MIDTAAGSSLSDGPDPTSSPADAPAPAKTAWRCELCGFVEEMDALPIGYGCPVCGAPRAQFKRIER